jgi:hypothetical protein
MTVTEASPTFHALRAILQPLEPALVKVHDTPDNYYLDTAHLMASRKPLFFGSVREGRRHVSFHLMPVYLWPDLLDNLSEDLRARMQGKSCFNFRLPDPQLLAELEALTRRGFDRYRETGYLA